MTNNEENTFAYNVLMPGVLLFAAGVSIVFGLMLLIFQWIF